MTLDRCIQNQRLISNGVSDLNLFSYFYIDNDDVMLYDSFYKSKCAKFAP